MNRTVAAQQTAGDRLIICDVALFYAERSGGIRTYLNEKARFAAQSGTLEHHLVVPGKRERHLDGHHELRSLQLAASNGYRLPFGAGPLRETLRAIRPDVVILHDPFWRPLSVTREAHRLGRLSLEKRIADILEAMALAGWNRPLRIVGDGPAKGVIEARARRLGLADRLEFRPFVADRRVLARTYREAACVVAPGPHETFGLAVLEAAASGARVVACSSTPAAVLAGPLVRTFRAKRPKDLARAIDRALATPRDPVAASALGASLSWPRVFEAELRDLKRLCRR